MADYIKATKKDVLTFIKERKIISPYELAERFRFSPKYVRNLLWRLKKAGLVINMTKGRWELTEDGYRRLKYYDKRQSGGA